MSVPAKRAREPKRVIIAGAGPAGSTLARELAKAGHSVLVLERKKRSALGHDWSDAVEREGLTTGGFSLPPAAALNTGPLVKRSAIAETRGAVAAGTTVEKRGAAPAGIAAASRPIFEEHGYPEMDVWAPDLSCSKRIPFRYITTDRKLLDTLLVDMAVEAGAEFLFEQEVIGLLFNSPEKSLGLVDVGGVTVRALSSGVVREERGDIVIDCTGFGARLRTLLPKETGISEEFPKSDFAMVYRTVRKLDPSVDSTVTDHYRYGYCTGYQWAQYLDSRTVDIGAGVRAEQGDIDPGRIAGEYIARHPEITGTELRGGGGLCLVGRSPASLAAGRFLCVGDAAAQTIPMTGCGVGGAIAGAMYAAEVVRKALKRKRPDIETLWPYNAMWFVTSGRGANYAALTAMRNVLQTLSHDDISFLFRKDIMNARMLGASINGEFLEPGTGDLIAAAAKGLGKPGVLRKLSEAVSMGKAVKAHYLNYPMTWDPGRFSNWKEKAEELFSRF